MPLTQADIRERYEQEWSEKSASAGVKEDLKYSSPVEDRLLYPAYIELLRRHNIGVGGRDVLDVGSGCGRWIAFFARQFIPAPASITGVDYTLASVDLLRKWWGDSTGRGTALCFRHASITDPSLDLGQKYDLINIANVLFHIPEDDGFRNALKNLRRHLKPGGRIITTEYLPRQSMRTEWMLVRSRYEFTDLCLEAGLQVDAVRAFCYFGNDPMGIDGPDAGARADFYRVRSRAAQLLASAQGATHEFLVEMLADIDRAALNFSRERLAEIDLPSQKLVILSAI